MNDVYAINVAKTDFREGYNTGDINRLMATFQPDGFTDMSEAEPSKYGSEAIAVWRKRLAELFAGYHTKLAPIIINIVVLGGTAYDYGWHELTLTPKAGGVASPEGPGLGIELDLEAMEPYRMRA